MEEFFLFDVFFSFERQKWGCIWMGAKVEGTRRNRWRRNHNQYVLIRKKNLFHKNKRNHFKIDFNGQKLFLKKKK